MSRFVLLLLLVIAWAGFAAAQPLDALRAVAPENPDGRLAHILKRGTLIVGVKADYPPWGMVNPDPDSDAIVGIEPDLARDIADRLGVGLQLEVVSAQNRIGRVNDGSVDLIIATMGDTEVRRHQADLIQPNYYSSGVVVYGRTDLGLSGWEALRDAPVCLTQGAYFNRTLERDFGLKGQYFPGNREARLALKYGRCVGWAFDDTALAQLVHTEHEPGFGVIVPTILDVPWAVAVASGEGDGQWGRFVADMVGEWHATGRILELQRKWWVGETEFLRDLHKTWSRVENGMPFCTRDPHTGRFPADCLFEMEPVATGAPVDLPEWAAALRERAGIDLRVLYDAYDRARLVRGLGLTLALGSVAILGGLAVGIGFGLIDARARRMGPIGQVVRLPLRGFIVLARMTPPILQLYIVFFALGGLMANAGIVTPGSFVTAGIILSSYAGATNAVLLSHALEHERLRAPDAELLALLPEAIRRCFDGLVATCVNIIKAAGMASAIALTELVSTVNLLVAEGGDKGTLMNGLLVFYFVFVLCVIWLFRLARNRLAPGGEARR
ncbi:transporter substrate-binding domain-containing protein [Rhodovulum steppense]|uniref:Polar amino acid transport system substrate-binding protein n=1 Tax=Rhodovulum steppense TaxID=540251 RepID=A0A4V2R4U5_9RHOB|nr:transporter substrate-binding domain-containing protein [Rhodovulum steppense]TCM86134.1 polar amino acid transport system substrate-binding protein [Rhodovulum steppense]